MKKYTRDELWRMTRRQLWEVGFTMCSERDLCNEKGGFRLKQQMIYAILKRQEAYSQVYGFSINK